MQYKSYSSAATAIGSINVLTSGLLLLAGLLSACVHDGSSAIVEADDTAEYHADYDIAMTMRSLTDAIAVGETLDSTEYNFKGILTDGTGYPLYTALEGIPGEWSVEVVSGDRVVITNSQSGNISAEDIESYVADCLDLDNEDLVASDESETPEGDRLRTVYDFGAGLIEFESVGKDNEAMKRDMSLRIIISAHDSLPEPKLELNSDIPTVSDGTQTSGLIQTWGEASAARRISGRK